MHENAAFTVTAALEAVTISSLLQEYRDGRDPIVSYEVAARILPALGRPLSLAQVRDLIVMTWTLGGRNVAPLSRFADAPEGAVPGKSDCWQLAVKRGAVA